MVKFVLLLTLWSAESRAPEVYVLDHALTGEDCIAQLMDSYKPDSLGTLSCEVDHGWKEGEE